MRLAALGRSRWLSSGMAPSYGWVSAAIQVMRPAREGDDIAPGRYRRMGGDLIILQAGADALDGVVD